MDWKKELKKLQTEYLDVNIQCSYGCKQKGGVTVIKTNKGRIGKFTIKEGIQYKCKCGAEWSYI